MSIFEKYTLRNLKKNKARTLITVIGIILSVAMFTATAESFVTVYNFLIDYETSNSGTYHVSFHGISSSEYKEISEDDRIKRYTFAQDIGYAKSESVNKDKPYIFIAGVPSDYTDTSAIFVIEGRLPQNDTEIILSEHIISNGGVDIDVGDTLTLETGKRVLSEDSSGIEESIDASVQYLGQEIPYQHENEALSDIQTKTYTVVGLCKRGKYDGFEPRTAPGYTAYTLTETKNENTAGTMFCVLEDASGFNKFSEDYKNKGTVKINRDLLMFSLELHDNAYEGMFYGLAAVLVAIIVFGSVALIFNSFSISLSERTRQYGLLKSIGATKKQIIRSVIFEAFVLCLIAIPIGLISGCVGIFITFKALGGIITQLMSEFSGMEMRFILSFPALTMSALLSTLTIILSAYIPAKRAIRISPVDAIRQNKDIKIKKRHVRISPLTKKLFGFEGMISAKNFKRSKKRYAITVFSLFVSTVMFISASSLSSYFTSAVETEAQDMNYDISVFADKNLNEDETKNFITSLKSIKEADSFAVNENCDINPQVNIEYLSEAYIEFYGNISSVYENGYANNTVSVCFINDDAFKECLKENNIPQEEYFNKNMPKALLYDNQTLIYYDSDGRNVFTYSYFDKSIFPCILNLSQTKNITDFFIEEIYEENGTTYYRYRKGGDEGEDLSQNESIILPESEAKINYSINIGKVLPEKPFFVGGPGCAVIYPASMKEYSPFSDYSYSVAGYFKATHHTETEAAVRRALMKNGLTDKTSCYNYASDIETIRGVVIISKVLAYGFIILISLIAAANVFNTISTNIMLRRREFATLKSVGLSEKGLHKMMIYESLLYGFKSLLLSLPVSTLITFIIYFIIQESGYEIKFYLPPEAYIIAVLSVFIIVFISMIYSVRKIKKTDILTAIKDENM
ncbi:MAG: ABC transporter permease [Ruminococcaceae bacterium]|nr:ABC transporter permease [Oscillospiraceae bacterium]